MAPCIKHDCNRNGLSGKQLCRRGIGLNIQHDMLEAVRQRTFHDFGWIRHALHFGTRRSAGAVQVNQHKSLLFCRAPEGFPEWAWKLLDINEQLVDLVPIVGGIDDLSAKSRTMNRIKNLGHPQDIGIIDDAETVVA